jgi:hypothetical protein
MAVAELVRFDDWPVRLARHLLDATDRVFLWGVHDCCTFACDGIEAMTGLDPMAPARGRYRDDRQAAAILREIGGGGLPEAADHLMSGLGAPLVHPAFAQRGDLVLIEVPVMNLREQRGLAGGALRAEKNERAAGVRADETDFCLGLVAPDGRVAVAALLGLAFFDARQAARAWSI